MAWVPTWKRLPPRRYEKRSAKMVRAYARHQSEVLSGPRSPAPTGTLTRIPYLSRLAAPLRVLVIPIFPPLSLIWGPTYLGFLFAFQSIPPFLMAGSRFFLAGLIMFAIARTQGPLRSTWAEWR